MEEHLNQLGEQGWELVAASLNIVVWHSTFKRPKT
jgi:hypothetical protein